MFDFYNSSHDLLIVVYPQIGPNYDELRWPFKAEFVTHLSSQSNPRNVKKFKSELIVRKRRHFRPDFFVYPFTIATFTIGEFLEHFINREAEFEIFVVLL